MRFILGIIVALLDLYTIALIVRLVFTWLPPRKRAGRFHDFLEALTEPVLRPFRRVLPPIGGLDFSPVLPLLILQIIRGLFESARGHLP